MEKLNAKFINHEDEVTSIVILKIEDKKVYFYPLKDIDSIEIDPENGYERKVEYHKGFLHIADYYRIHFDV